MSDEEIYEKFINWMRQTWVELPESEYLRPLIKAFYTPEEAALLTGMSFGPKGIEELGKSKGMDPAELEPKLKELAGKGMVYESIGNEPVRYSLADSLFAFLRGSLWAEHPEEHVRKAAPFINKYFKDVWWEQFIYTRQRGLRTIPIDETIEDPRQVLPFEDVVKVVDDREYYTVSRCPCRQRYKLDPDEEDCTFPDEVCLHFDELGRYIVENDLGREITREETLEILEKAADSGLVHGISNWENGPDTI